MDEGRTSRFISRPGLTIPTSSETSFVNGFKIARELNEGNARFELLDSSNTSLHPLPLASISSSFMNQNNSQKHFFFARAAPNRGSSQRPGASQAIKKLEYYTLRRIAGDGRCMFRALVSGMAANKGIILRPWEEEEEADQLRMAVADVLCGGDEKRRNMYEEALIAITLDESIKSYCKRLQSHDFWGGESELLVLSRMCSQPITVYISESDAKHGARWGAGYIPIVEYGTEFTKSGKERKGRKPVKLLYNGKNHYDLLI